MKINKKIKAFMSIIMACFMCVGVLLSIKADVYADSSKEYVYDNAGILTSDEVSKLKSQCKKASEDSECDIVIITTNIGHDGSTMDSYLKKFLDDNGYSQNAVIYGVDMQSRADRMYTQGKAGTDISQGTIDDIREACEEKLSDKDYYKAFSKYIKNMNMCMTTSIVKKLTYKMWIKLLIASGVAVAAVLTMMHNAKARMTVSSTEYTKTITLRLMTEETCSLIQQLLQDILSTTIAAEAAAEAVETVAPADISKNIKAGTAINCIRLFDVNG